MFFFLLQVDSFDQSGCSLKLVIVLKHEILELVFEPEEEDECVTMTLWTWPLLSILSKSPIVRYGVDFNTPNLELHLYSPAIEIVCTRFFVGILRHMAKMISHGVFFAVYSYSIVTVSWEDD